MGILYLTVPIFFVANIFYTEGFRPSYLYHWIANKMLFQRYFKI